MDGHSEQSTRISWYHDVTDGLFFDNLVDAAAIRMVAP